MRSRFVAALNAGDVHGATACFARNGRLFGADASAIRGRGAIAVFLIRLVDLGTKVEVESSETLESSEFLELASERWRICSGGEAGKTSVRECNATLALHCLEGAWGGFRSWPWNGLPDA